MIVLVSMVVLIIIIIKKCIQLTYISKKRDIELKKIILTWYHPWFNSMYYNENLSCFIVIQVKKY